MRVEIHVKNDFHVIWLIIIHNLWPSIFVKEGRLRSILRGARWIIFKHALDFQHLLVPVCHVVLILLKVLEITDSFVVLSPDIIQSLHPLFLRQSCATFILSYSPWLLSFRNFLAINQIILSVENCWSSWRVIFQIYNWNIIIDLSFLSFLSLPLFLCGFLILGGRRIDLSFGFLDWVVFIAPLSRFVEEFTEH